MKLSRIYSQFIFRNNQLLLLFFLLLMACAQKEQNQHREVKAVIDQFYDKPLGDYHLAERSLLSKSLSLLLDEAAKIQSEDSARLKSMGSTDKPLMLEGDLFTSLYEGCTGHQIQAVTQMNDSCRVTVSFTNRQIETYTWSDTILLIREGELWKIDDILYTKGKGAGKSTRDVLYQFIGTSKETTISAEANTSDAVTKDTLTKISAKSPLRTGQHQITLQWIGWDKPGAAEVAELPGGTYSIQGIQKGETDSEYLKIDGTLTPHSETELHFKGKIQTRIAYINHGTECLRDGKYTFKKIPGKKYWRLQEKINCEGGQTTDYIDIYF